MKSPVFQINYGTKARQVTEMFARLAQNMLNEELVAGVPKIVTRDDGNVKIVQLYGQCPSTSGSMCIVKLVGDDLWEVSYDDGSEKVTLVGPDINKFFSGDY